MKNSDVTSLHTYNIYKSNLSLHYFGNTEVHIIAIQVASVSEDHANQQNEQDSASDWRDGFY